MTNHIQEIKKVEKQEKDNGWKGAVVEYINSEGKEKRQVFDEFDCHFNEDCPNCGEKKFKCRINKSEEKNKKRLENGDLGNSKEKPKKVKKTDITDSI